MHPTNDFFFFFLIDISTIVLGFSLGFVVEIKATVVLHCNKPEHFSIAAGLSSGVWSQEIYDNLISLKIPGQPVTDI